MIDGYDLVDWHDEPTPTPRLRATVIRVMLAGLVIACVVGVVLARSTS